MTRPELTGPNKEGKMKPGILTIETVMKTPIFRLRFGKFDLPTVGFMVMGADVSILRDATGKPFVFATEKEAEEFQEGK